MSWAAVAAAGVGVVGSMAANKGGGGGGSTTSSNAPWLLAQQPLHENMLYAQDMVHNPSPLLTQGVNAQAQRAQQGNPLNQAAQSNALQTLNGGFMSPNSNPYLRDTVNQAMGDAKTQINAQFSGDNYGSSAHQEWLSKGLMNQALPMYNQNYQQERQRQMGAQALAPTLANQDYTDITQLQNAGNARWDQLNRAQSIYQGAGGMGGTQTQPYFQNQAAGMMGGALGGLALYNGINQSGLSGAPMGQEMVPGQYSLINQQYG